MNSSSIFYTDLVLDSNSCAGALSSVADPFYLNCPFGFFASGNSEFIPDTVRLCFRHRSCTGRAEEGSERCKLCAKLEHHPPFRALIDRASDKKAHLKGHRHSELTCAQLALRVDHHSTKRDEARLQSLNIVRALSSAKSKLSVYDQLIRFMGDHDVPRARVVITRCIRNGSGPKAIKLLVRSSPTHTTSHPITLVLLSGSKSGRGSVSP